MTLRVAASLSEWARRLQAHAADHAEELDVTVVRDRRGALQSQCSVLCLDVEARWVDQALIAAASERKMIVVGVYQNERDEQRWIDWGVEHRMAARTPGDGMTYLLGRLVTLAPRDDSLPPGAGLRSGDGIATLTAPLVFGGPAGAGAREIAIGAAAVLARHRSTVLVDLNECGGGVARRLGYAEAPNVLTGADLVATGGDVMEAAAAPVLGRGVGFDVLTGLPSAAEWTGLSARNAARLVEACRARWNAVVVTTSPVVEDLGRWVDRYAVSRGLLGSARRVIGVCEASPRGVVRFGEWLADVRPSVAVSVVINKVPPRAAYVVGEVREQLVSMCGPEWVEVIGVVPFDARVPRAEWNATLPRSGSFVRAMRGMDRDLATMLAAPRAVATR